jgi:hypothetical protein
MKQRLSIIFAFALLAAAIVALEIQLHFLQLKSSSEANVTDVLSLACIKNCEMQAAQKDSAPETKVNPDSVRATIEPR